MNRLKITLLFTLSIFMGSIGLAQDDTIVQATILDSADAAADKLYNSGIESFKRKQYEEAINAFTQAIELKPDFELAFFNRAATKLEA
ncbi:MAG: tetratricopeptide repeat protein, partial [Crocinitomicaceae bacterium]|nr:tetratricopeptide repeat protein [Crocinitomicaceae bacterium]